MRRLTVVLVFALIAAACGSGNVSSGQDGPPACVTDMDALADLLVDEGITASTETLAKLRVGENAPDFALCDANGNIVQLSDFAGQPVMLVFWAEWCVFCAVEMPTLEAALAHWPDDLVIITIATRGDAEKNWVHYHNEKFTFPVVFDTDDNVAERYLNLGIPQTIFIAPDGTIADAVSGAIHLDRAACIETLTQFAEGRTNDIIISACT